MLTIVLLAIAGIVIAKEDAHCFVGQKAQTDKLLWSGKVQEYAQLISRVEKKIEFPSIAHVEEGPIITFINVTNLYQIFEGGSCKIKKGGIGQKNVGLKFKSNRGFGLDYEIAIYGH